MGVASVLCLGAVGISSVYWHGTSLLQNIIYTPQHDGDALGQSILRRDSGILPHKPLSLTAFATQNEEDKHRRQMLPSFKVIQKVVGVSKTVLRTKNVAKHSETGELATALTNTRNLANIFSYRRSDSSSESKSKDSKSKSRSKSSSKSNSKSKSESKQSSKSKSDSKSKEKESERSKQSNAGKSKIEKYGDTFQGIIDEMLMEKYGKESGKGGGGGGGGGGGYDDGDDNNDEEEGDYYWYQDNGGNNVFGKSKGSGHNKSGKLSKMTSKSSKLTKFSKASKGKGYSPPPRPPSRPPTRRPPTQRPPTFRPPTARPPTNPSHEGQRIRYVRQKRKWNQYDIVDYDITTTNCGGEGRCDSKWRAPKRVEIRNGVIAQVSYAETGGVVERDYEGSAFTVDILYRYLGIALGRNAADIVRTRYNSDYSYPSYAEIFDEDDAGAKGRSFNVAPGWWAVSSQQVVDAIYTVTDFCDCGEGCCGDFPPLFPTPMPTSRPTLPPAERDTCVDGGGTVTSRTCCEGAGVYPNTCRISCLLGCGPDSIVFVPFCECEIGFCWDGSECVEQRTPAPVQLPTTPAPVQNSTTDAPSGVPSVFLTSSPSLHPSQSPSDTAPTTQPPARSSSERPSSSPTVTVTSRPTVPNRSDSPSVEPTIMPSFSPSTTPTTTPTEGPTDAPDEETELPSSTPSLSPTESSSISYSLSYFGSFSSSYSASLSTNVTDSRQRHRNRRRVKARRQRRRLQSVRSPGEQVDNGSSLAPTNNEENTNDEEISVSEEDIQWEIGGLRYQR